MADSSPKFRHLSPDDVTLDAQAVALAAEEEAARPKVQLVEGSGPDLAGQTECVLRARLRAAALVLLVGSATFLVRNEFDVDLRDAWDQHVVQGQHLMYWFHVS